MRYLRSICLWAALITALTAPARADEAVICLQEQLAALGFDPGKADGQAGPATRSALADYEAANTPLSSRTLDSFTALVFCRELGLRDPALAEFWPSDGRRLRVEVAGPRDDDLRAALLAEANDALTLVETQMDLRLAAPIDIVIGSTPQEIVKRAQEFTAFDVPALQRRVTELCQDAPDFGVNFTHLPGVILFCHQPGVTFGLGFYPIELRKELGRLMAVEMMLQLTGDTTTGSDADYYRRNGPMWLIVGTMQLLQRELDGNATPLGRQKAAERLRQEGVPHPRTMELAQANLEDPVGLGRTGLLVTDDLTRETGLAPIAAFYRALGIGSEVEDAFRLAFGRTLAEIYEGYP
jgi:hypothetical protein